MMEFSMRSFAVVSLLLLVSLSTDMSGPLVVDAGRCDWGLCEQYCNSLGLPACCPGPAGPCQCTAMCPRNRIMSAPLARVRRCDSDLCTKYCSHQNLPGCCSAFNNQCLCAEICPNKEPFIKEVVIA